MDIIPEKPKEFTNRNRKGELLSKTAKIFAEKGYQACTVQEIALALSISKGGLYWHFKSKEELYLQVCESYCISSVEAIQLMLEKDSVTFEELHGKFTMLLEGYLDDPIQVDLIIDFYAEAKRSKLIHNKLIELMAQRERLLIILIKKLVFENIVEPIDPIWTAKTLVSSLMGLLLKFALLRDKKMVIEEFDLFFASFFQKKK